MKDVQTTFLETEAGPLVCFTSEDPRGFSFTELDVLIAAARHAQRRLIERGNQELQAAANEEYALEAAFEDQQAKLPIDS